VSYLFYQRFEGNILATIIFVDVNIILLGYMGSGKTSLGRHLSTRMGMRFVDTDSAIERQTERSVPVIFRDFGEQYFRTLEKNIIQELRQQDNLLIATGGGLPCFNDMMNMLKELGTTVYLERSAKELAHRILHSPQPRPLIEHDSMEELTSFIQDMLSVRSHFYEQAHIIATRNDQQPHRLTQLIHRYLNESVL